MNNRPTHGRTDTRDTTRFWQYVSRLNNWLIPTLCPLCGLTQEDPSAISCEACETIIEPNQAGCAICNDHIENGEICGQCIKEPPAFDSINAAWLYKTPMDELIYSAKFRENYALARQLGRTAADYFTGCYFESMPQVLVPAPLHPTRLSERGYNQASLIATGISRVTGIPILNTAIHKKRSTPAQSNLGIAQRVTNLRNTFVAHKVADIDHVAIVDDVATSGSTFNELAKALKRVGYTQVDCWCLARVKR